MHFAYVRYKGRQGRANFLNWEVLTSATTATAEEEEGGERERIRSTL